MVQLRPLADGSARRRVLLGDWIMAASGFSRLLICLALAAASAAVASCSSQAQTNCAPGLYEYKGGCLSNVSQNFVTCTETRGNDLSVEERQKLGASVDAGIRGGASGVIEISKKVVETELPDVALEIVRVCLQLSEQLADPAEQVAIQQQIEALQAMIDGLSQGTISLDPDRGPYNQVITVSGAQWPPGVEVEATAATARVRTTTRDDGTFETTISLDPTFEGVSGSTVVIRVSPVKASMQLPATALYTIEK
jgi:hypothetical protein